jgi:hypothetical protein
MRSDLVFGVAAHISNRFYLCQLVSKGARKLHKPQTRLQDTTNDVLVLLLHSCPIAEVVPQSAHFEGRLAA